MYCKWGFAAVENDLYRMRSRLLFSIVRPRMRGMCAAHRRAKTNNPRDSWHRRKLFKWPWPHSRGEYTCTKEWRHRKCCKHVVTIAVAGVLRASAIERSSEWVATRNDLHQPPPTHCHQLTLPAEACQRCRCCARTPRPGMCMSYYTSVGVCCVYVQV